MEFEEDDIKTSVKSNSNTPMLDTYGVNITKLASEGKIDTVVGREKEIDRIAQILTRRKKNNPILIGEPGVGKSAIAWGLALKIVKKEVSRTLIGKSVYELDIASMVSGSKYRGQFEERIKALISELSKNRDIILFIDEIHTIVGAGGASGSLDAANMMKPALARGEIQCIGATTLNEYKKHIEKDGALERRFQKVIVEPTSVEESITILKNIKEHYEKHHNVIYTDEAIEACVKLTDRYLTDRHLPDKAIDALDEAGSRVHINNIVVPEYIKDIEMSLEDVRNSKFDFVKNQNFEEAAKLRDSEKKIVISLSDANKKWQEDLSNNKTMVTESDIECVVSMMTGVPLQRIGQDENIRLSKINEELQNGVIGQDEAIKKVASAIKRNRVGLKDPNKPIGSFIFLGPTGVGKTQLSKVLAKYLFGSHDSLIRVDMSEYMEKFNVSRLVGAAPGYVGYEEGGQLTEKVRRKPYSIVLFDEIEKAHPDIFNILLQILDEGHITDSLGRKVDFKNTIIIMTSNVGARDITDFNKSVGFSSKSSSEQMTEHSKGIIEKALKKTFAPEFLNRIDDVIQFNSLDKVAISKIIDIELKGLFDRIKEMNYDITISEKAKDYIIENGYDLKFGARPLKRAIQKYVEDPLAEFIISGQATSNMIIDIENDEIVVKNVEKTVSKRKKKDL
ncbi:ATP-dependent Clp protease ATP-binding subunit [bacterium]|jgi:ATP-dependent Clp protease ATP-binding subunit ClpC|nr:ATP-dependent Clp protease ATP-binding subunit [bacterium]